MDFLEKKNNIIIYRYNMNAHFIDLDILIETHLRAWVVSKDKPNYPLLKIEKHEFNLFKSGIYKSHNNKINFNGKTFWLPNDFMNKVKVESKRQKVDISNLAISMQEFLNKDLIKNEDIKINMSMFNNINSEDDIYIICSKNNKNNYSKAILKLNEILSESNLSIKNYYYVSETFYNRNEDDISLTKVKILLQHLIGLKTDIDKITEEDITDYNKVYYYDNSISSIELSKRINIILEKFLSKTEDSVKLKVKDRIKNFDNVLIVKEYTGNKANKFNETYVPLEYSNIIRNYTNF